MAEPSKETDQSMEDILQSIKRIIADEGEPSAVAPGSDVLELTELLAEDVAIAPPPPVAAPAAASGPKTAQDDIDALFNTPDPAPIAEAPAVVEAAPVAPPAAPVPAPVATAPTAPAAATTSSGLMSDTTLAASVAALQALSHRPAAPHGSSDSPIFRSGLTVEDLVMEALKPMLKEWLDGNLPTLVRTLVEKEIHRLSN
ncbi:MAG: DUF2497 domain-containing protein [Rickettsiales bacterium]